MIKDSEDSSILRRHFEKHFRDLWKIFDWATIIFILSCIFTHISDIIDHNYYIAKVHNRLTSISFMFLCIRLLKMSRIVIPKLGVLVMVIYYALIEMVTWMVLFGLFWLSFSK